MSNDMQITFVHSQESEIDRVLEDLIGKLVAGELSPKEEAEFGELLAHRSRLMRPYSLYRVHREERLNAA